MVVWMRMDWVIIRNCGGNEAGIGSDGRFCGM